MPASPVVSSSPRDRRQKERRKSQQNTKVAGHSTKDVTTKDVTTDETPTILVYESPSSFSSSQTLLPSPGLKDSPRCGVLSCTNSTVEAVLSHLPLGPLSVDLVHCLRFGTAGLISTLHRRERIIVAVYKCPQCEADNDGQVRSTVATMV